VNLGEVFPPELLLQAVLVRGGAFRADYEFWNEGLKERYFFVGNHEPHNDEKVLLFTSTTQIDKRQRHHRERAKLVLVEISKTDYPEIEQDSVIDCDCAIVRRARNDFEAQAKRREYRPLTPLPESIMAKICDAVRAAKTLSPVEKRTILGPDRE